MFCVRIGKLYIVLYCTVLRSTIQKKFHFTGAKKEKQKNKQSPQGEPKPITISYQSNAVL